MFSKTEAGPSAPELETGDSVLAPKPRRRGRFACFIGMILGLSGVLAAWFGNLWIAFDVFAQFWIHFWLIALAFGIGFLMPAARVLTAIVVLVAGLLAIGAWPHLDAATYPAARLEAPQGHRIIRVMSFNAWLGNTDLKAIAAEVERNDPDIVLMFEFGPEKRALQDRLRASYRFQEDCIHLEHCYMAVFSKYPIIDSESHAEWVGPPMIRVSFGTELGDLTIIGTHTLRFPYLRDQLTQLVELGSMMRKLIGPRMVVGDFNAVSSSRMLAIFEQNSGLRRLDRWLPTWPARFQLPQLGIDHIFASDEVKTMEDVRIGNNAGSDHYPLVVRVAVPAGP